MKKYTTSERLKEIMDSRNLRQVDILSLVLPYCKEYGVKMNKSDLSQYVSGKVEPNQDKLVVLGMALGVNETWLMGFDVPMGRCFENSIPQPLGSKDSLILSDIANLLHDKPDQIQHDALLLMEIFVNCNAYNQGRILAYAQGISDHDQVSVEDEIEQIRKEQIERREKRIHEGSVPTKKSV